MRNARIVSRLLERSLRNAPLRVAEIGAGDGTFFLQVAQRLATPPSGTQLWLVDRQQLLAPSTEDRLRKLGWRVEAVQADVFDWLATTTGFDVVLANLFLHHFDNHQLKLIFERLATRTNKVVACEPRRFAFPKLAGKLVRLIGCNFVTEHDATASVRAGFRGQELTKSWPDLKGWELDEAEAGLFSHWFVAERVR
jgi:hypothetical protein